MEFFSESRHKSRKERTCEMCGGDIHTGEYYYSERGKFNGEFFSRDMHVCCHNMESEFCEEVDNEFSWDEILDYVREKHCGNCEHAACNDDREDWEECPYGWITECPKIMEKYEDKDRFSMF